jgi:hypothetical protein
VPRKAQALRRLTRYKIVDIVSLMKKITDELLEEVELFLSQHKELSASALSVAACRNEHAVKRLRMGEGCNTRRVDQLRAFMRDYKSAGQGLRRSKSRSIQGVAA